MAITVLLSNREEVEAVSQGHASLFPHDGGLWFALLSIFIICKLCDKRTAFSHFCHFQNTNIWLQTLLEIQLQSRVINTSQMKTHGCYKVCDMFLRYNFLAKTFLLWMSGD